MPIRLLKHLLLLLGVIALASCTSNNLTKQKLPEPEKQSFLLVSGDASFIKLDRPIICSLPTDDARFGAKAICIKFGKAKSVFKNHCKIMNRKLPSDTGSLWMQKGVEALSLWAKSDKDVKLSLSLLLFFKPSAQKVTSSKIFNRCKTSFSIPFTIKKGEWQRIILPFDSFSPRLNLRLLAHSRARLDIKRSMPQGNKLPQATVWLDHLEAVPLSDENSGVFFFTKNDHNVFLNNEPVILCWEKAKQKIGKNVHAELTITPYAKHDQIILSKAISLNKSQGQIKIDNKDVSKFGPYEAFFDVIEKDGKRARRHIVFGRAPKLTKNSSAYPCLEIGTNVEPRLFFGRGAVRVPYTWRNYEQKTDVLNDRIGFIDYALDHYRKLNVPVMLSFSFGRFPTWSYKPNSTLPRMDCFLTHLEKLIKRYRGKIEAIEIGNEVNMAHYFAGTYKDYFEYLKASYKLIKKIAPEIKVAGPALTGGFHSYFEKLFKLGALQYLDVITYHNYTTNTGPCAVDLPGRIGEVRKLIKKYGGSQPMWDSEFGFAVPPRHQGLPITAERIAFLAKTEPKSDSRSKHGLKEYCRGFACDVLGEHWHKKCLTEKEAANALARQFAIGMASGLEKAFYFDNGHYSLRTLNSELRPIGYSWINFSKQMGQAQDGKRINVGNDKVYIYQFKKGNAFIYIAWSMIPEQLVAQCSSKEIRKIDLYGNEQRLSFSGACILLPTSRDVTYLKSPLPINFQPYPLQMQGTRVFFDKKSIIKLAASNPFNQTAAALIQVKLNNKELLKKECALQAGKSLNYQIDICPQGLPFNQESKITAELKINGKMFSKTMHVVRFKSLPLPLIKAENQFPKLSDCECMQINDFSQLTGGKKSDFESTAVDKKWEGIKDLSAKVKLAADTKNIFVNIDVTDDQLVAKKSNQVYRNDSVEIYRVCP